MSEISTNVEIEQVNKAVKALCAFIRSSKNLGSKNSALSAPLGSKRNLLGAQKEKIHLVLSLNKVHRKNLPNPKIIPVVHPLHLDSDICIFVKDPQSVYKEEIKKNNIPVKEVIGLSQLKKSQEYNKKRDLCLGYDLFLADERIIPSLPPLLGKAFFSRKKQPVPISTKNLQKQVRRIMNSTFLILNKGTCSSVYIANSDFKESEIVENILQALPKIIEKIPGKWDNVASINIKSANSVGLPIYSKLAVKEI